MYPEFTEDTQIFHQLLEELGKTHAIRFAYDSDISPTAIQHNYSRANDLQHTLKEIFFLSNLEYQISDSLILLRQKLDTQSDRPLRGRVLDGFTFRPMENVLVRTTAGRYTFTDALGFFMIDTQSLIDTGHIEFSYLGYEWTKHSIGSLQKPCVVKMDIFPFTIPMIRVHSRATRPDVLIPVSRETASEGMRLASMPAGLDIFRQLQLLPGLLASNDASARMLIRGSESYETLVKLDGMTLYNPTHFYSIFSSVNPSFVDRVELYKNNLPIEEPSRTGGLVVLRSADVQPDRRAGNMDVDLLNASIHARIPFSAATGLSVAGRTSYLNAGNSSFFDLFRNRAGESGLNGFQESLVLELNPSFHYFDLNAKFETEDIGQMRSAFHFYLSQDKLTQYYQEEKAPTSSLPLFRFTYDNKTRWQNLALASEHRWAFSENHTGLLQIQYSTATFSEDFLFVNQIVKPSSQSKFNKFSQLDNGISDFHTSFLGSWELPGSSDVKYGFEFGRFEAQSEIRLDSQSVLAMSDQEYPVTLFQEWHKKTGSWSFRLGSRFSLLPELGRYYFDPRLLIQFTPKNKSGQLYSSLSYNHQYLTQFSFENHLGQSYEFWVISNADFPLLRSWNAMMGYKESGKSWSLTAELFGKWRYGLTEFALTRPGFSENGEEPDEFRLFEGNGRIIGLDLLMRKKWGEFETQVSYTLSANLVRFPEIFQGQFFPSQDHRLHQLKWQNQYRLRSWSFQLNTIYSSGRPYLDVSILDKKLPRSKLNPDRLVSYLPYYLRIDPGVEYTFSRKGRKLIAGISIFNVLDRKNLYHVQYIKPVQSDKPDSAEYLTAGAQTTLLGRTLNVRLAFSFD